MIIIDRADDTTNLALNTKGAEIIKFTCIQTNVVTTMEVTDTSLSAMRCGIYAITTSPLAVGQYIYEIGSEKGVARVIDSEDTDHTYNHDLDNQVYHG